MAAMTATPPDAQAASCLVAGIPDSSGTTLAMVASVVPELSGIPATRHEAACASGGVAVMAAMADLESGRYDVALVLGVEIERNVPGTVGAGYMASASW